MRREDVRVPRRGELQRSAPASVEAPARFQPPLSDPPGGTEVMPRGPYRLTEALNDKPYDIMRQT